MEGDSLRQFFQGTLRIPNISHEHIFQELDNMDEPPDADTVGNLYRLLQNMCESDPSIESSLRLVNYIQGHYRRSANHSILARNTFEKSSLVYAEMGGTPGWYSPSQCLWSSTTSIEGKVVIKDQHAEFDKFFTSVLGVPRVDLAMMYDSLLDAATSGATTEQVKQRLLDFNALLRNKTEPPSPRRLLQRRIFPVKSGGATRLSRETEFFIVDRDDLFAAFGDRVMYLDFSLSDVCRLRPFIAWAGLETRYLSRCVNEESIVQGGVEVPIRDPKRDIKYKAYGLLRYIP